MRVGFDARTIASSGIGTYSRNLLSEFAELGLDLVVFCPDRYKDLIPGSGGFTIVSANANPASWLVDSTFANLVSEADVDLVHVPSHYAPGALEVPLVVTIHDVIPLLYPRSIRNPVERWQYRRQLARALESAREIVSVSRISRSALSAYARVDPSRVTVVHNGVSDRFHPVENAKELEAVRRRYALPERFALWIGEFRPQKNLEFLVSSWGQVLDETGGELHLVLAGAQSGEFGKIRREVTRRGSADRIAFPGFIRDEDLSALYSAAELFVFPSLYEGFGLPPLEAMACGTPCVVSNSSALPEATGRAALLFNPTEPAQFVECVMRVLRDDEMRARLRREGLRQAASFPWSRAAEETVAVYEKALG